MRRKKKANKTDAQRGPEELDPKAESDQKEPSAPTEASMEADATPAEGTTDALAAQVASLEDRLLRTKADYQNLVRRSANERSEAVRYANAELMKSLLPVLDDFERSLSAAETDDNLAAVIDGVRLVYENLIKALTSYGLSPIEALHQPFDPNVHEAMLQQPSADHPDQTVIEEFARGYRLRDRVIRPSRVIVSKTMDQDADQPGPSEETEQEAIG